MVETLSRQEHRIATEDDIALIARAVRELAQKRGFDAFATAAIATAASELSRNTLMHGKGGLAYLDEVADGRRVGLRLEFRDHGPGIADVARVLQGGFSTVRSLGLGISGSRRLVDDFRLDTEVGKGTVVTVEKWPRF